MSRKFHTFYHIFPYATNLPQAGYEAYSCSKATMPSAFALQVAGTDPSTYVPTVAVQVVAFTSDEANTLRWWRADKVLTTLQSEVEDWARLVMSREEQPIPTAAAAFTSGRN
jgi:hypothetical protein